MVSAGFGESAKERKVFQKEKAALTACVVLFEKILAEIFKNAFSSSNLPDSQVQN